MVLSPIRTVRSRWVQIPPTPETEEDHELVTRTLREYSLNAGMHGLRYLGERGRPWTERLWWVVAILLSLTGSSMLIHRVWHRWTETPVLVTFADQPSPIWEIPFPTVTMCPSNKYRSFIFDYKKAKEINRTILTTKAKRVVDDISLVCRSFNYAPDYDGDDFPLFTDQDTIDILEAVAPTFNNSIECSTLGMPCDGMFQQLMTRDGVCYTYNLLPNKTIFSPYAVQYEIDPNEPVDQVWTLDNGYRDSSGRYDIPIRASFVGFNEGIFFILYTNLSDLDYVCKPIQGFKIALTNPTDMPRMFERYYYVPMTGVTLMAVEPRVFDTSDSLRSYDPFKRHCYFPAERRLAYFSTYTQNNCDLECRTNYTLHECGCVEFYMPRNKSTPICAVGSTSCVIEAQATLNKEYMEDQIRHVKSKHICDCLPSCKSIRYNAEMSHGSMELDEIVKGLDLDTNTFKNISAHFLFVFMKNSDFIASRRGELYGLADFIANCGGLLGLCCGFSILSIAELVYYFTLRLWNNIKRQKPSPGQPGAQWRPAQPVKQMTPVNSAFWPITFIK